MANGQPPARARAGRPPRSRYKPPSSEPPNGATGYHAFDSRRSRRGDSARPARSALAPEQRFREHRVFASVVLFVVSTHFWSIRPALKSRRNGSGAAVGTGQTPVAAPGGGAARRPWQVIEVWVEGPVGQRGR